MIHFLLIVRKLKFDPEPKPGPTPSPPGAGPKLHLGSPPPSLTTSAPKRPDTAGLPPPHPPGWNLFHHDHLAPRSRPCWSGFLPVPPNRWWPGEHHRVLPAPSTWDRVLLLLQALSRSYSYCCRCSVVAGVLLSPSAVGQSRPAPPAGAVPSSGSGKKLSAAFAIPRESLHPVPFCLICDLFPRQPESGLDALGQLLLGVGEGAGDCTASGTGIPFGLR